MLCGVVRVVSDTSAQAGGAVVLLLRLLLLLLHVVIWKGGNDGMQMYAAFSLLTVQQ
jgi:hypothetical protein